MIVLALCTENDDLFAFNISIATLLRQRDIPLNLTHPKRLCSMLTEL